MSSYAKNCYPMALQAVNDALSKDRIGQIKEAYCCYLSSILFMIQSLKDEAWEKQRIEDLCHDEAFKLYKLTEHSLERARAILEGQSALQKRNTIAIASEVNKTKITASLSVPVAASKSQSLPAGLTRQNEIKAKSMKNLFSSLPAPPGLITSLPEAPSSVPSGSHLQPPGVDSLMTSLPTPPGYTASAYSTLPSRSTYQAKNYDMFQAYQYRKSKDTVMQKYASCDNNLSMWRQMAEQSKLNDVKEKEYQEKVAIRAQEIKVEAERRWNKTNARSCRDKEYRQNLLENILSYEQDARWPIEMRDTLVLSGEDANIIVKIVQAILTYKDHPLCLVLKATQYGIYGAIEPLVKHFSTASSSSTENYLQPVDSASGLDQSEGDVFENADPKVENSGSTETVLRDLEDDMFSESEEEEGEGEGNYDTLLKLREAPTTVDSSEDNLYDELTWEKPPETTKVPGIVTHADDEEETYEGTYLDPSSQHSTAPPSNYEGLEAYQENIYEDVNELVASVVRNERASRSIAPVTLKRLDSDFLKSTDRVIQDILFGIDRLHSVIVLTYQTLNTPAGRDLSYAQLEGIFFKPLWPWLIRLFRRMNEDKEKALAEVMSNYKECTPSKFHIRDKLTLEVGQQSEPYLEAIEEMEQVVKLFSPLDKLECIVRVSKTICQCVETYYSARGEKAPSIGCDDLLPLLSYVVLKTQQPEIVSECHAMTEFIHDGYLMGEEGYCLTTLHAAISNLLSFAEPQA